MKIDSNQNVRLSAQPVMFDIAHLANEAHTEAFQDIFVDIITVNRDIFSPEGEIRIQSGHPFKRRLGCENTVQTGRKTFETKIRVVDFLSDLRATALFLYVSDNATVDLYWNLGEKPLHLMMAFDNPYFVMKER